MTRRITIKSIALKEWRGQNHKITLKDGRNVLRGRNGCGKTSIYEAFVWVLSGYTNPNSPKNHNLYNNREELSKDTPYASVIVALNIDGNDYTIERKASPNFVRKRGTSEYVKSSSDSYIYLIDNIEVSVANFNEWINANICDVNNLLYCLSGEFFSTLCENDKNNARKVLETLIGEIKDSDFKGDYTLLNEKLKTMSVDAIIEQTKNNIKPLARRMDDIPSIIESKETTLSEYRAIDFNGILKEIENRKATINDIDNAILGRAESIAPILGERDKIFEIINSKTLSLNEHRNTYESKQRAITSEIKGKIEGIKRENERILETNRNLVNDYKDIEWRLSAAKKGLELVQKRREELLKQRDEVKARVFSEDMKCAYCGQEPPQEEVEKARVRFNAAKKNDLDVIVAKGKACKGDIERYEKEINELQAIVDKGVEELPYKSVEEYEKELQDAQSKYVPFESTKEYETLKGEIDYLKSTLPEIPQNDNEALTNTKRAIIEELDGLNRKYGLKDKANEIEKEIVTLREEKRNLGVEIAKLEGFLMNIQEWLQERANITSNRVNDKLTNCKIVMYSAQKDGSLKPDCVIMDNNNIKYATLNNSNRIKTNIELQQLFCEFYGIELPCWVDEAAIFSQNNLPKIESQHILLYASDDNYLIVE
jgi:DNA repair exonuclease SbcCD ATPase subunit